MGVGGFGCIINSMKAPSLEPQHVSARRRLQAALSAAANGLEPSGSPEQWSHEVKPPGSFRV